MSGEGISPIRYLSVSPILLLILKMSVLRKAIYKNQNMEMSVWKIGL